MTKESKSIEELYEIMEMINYEMSVRNSEADDYGGDYELGVNFVMTFCYSD